MTTRDDFERAIDASPRDSAVRFAFADWLENELDPEAARFQRWMGTHTMAAKYLDMSGRYVWDESIGTTDIQPPHALPPLLFWRCNAYHWGRIEAESALRRDLEWATGYE